MAAKPYGKASLAALALGGLAFAWAGNRLGALVSASPAQFPDNFAEAALALLPSLLADPLSFSCGPGWLGSPSFALTLVGAVLPLALFATWASSRGNFRPGEEEGSARAATVREMAAFADASDPYDNIILSRRARMALAPKGFDLEHDRNKNVLVLGGSGSGKTRYFVKPNLMQLSCSYVVTDPKGTLVTECGAMFDAAEYDLQVINTIDFSKSMRFNPLSFIRTEADIQPLVTCIVKNVKPKDSGSPKDPFWEQCEKLLMCAVIAFMVEALPRREWTFRTMQSLLALLQVSEEDDSTCPLDLIFSGWRHGELPTPQRGAVARGRQSARLEERWASLVGEPHPDSWACSLYLDQFRKGAGKTLKSVLMTVNSDLWVFGMPEVLKLTDVNEVNLDGIGGLVEADLARAMESDPGVARPGDGTPRGACPSAPQGQRKSALFLVMNDSDDTYNFLVAVAIYLVFNRLKNYADRSCPSGRLPIPVECVFDEFANIGKIEGFDQLISTIRSRNIGAAIILQSLSQLEKGYDKQSSETIMANCDTWVYLGGCAHETNKVISEMIGEETVNNRQTSRSYGQSPSSSQSDQLIKRSLMTPDEVGRIPRSRCLVLVKGENHFPDEKYRVEEHPRWRFIDPGHKGKRRFELGPPPYRLRGFGQAFAAGVMEPFDVGAWRQARDEARSLAVDAAVREMVSASGLPRREVPEAAAEAVAAALERYGASVRQGGGM